MKRVVITGAGAVSACGLGVDALWHAARDGESGIKPVSFPHNVRQKVMEAAAISAADFDTTMEGANPRFRDRVSAIAQYAAKEAIEQAGLQPEDFGTKCAVSVGSGYGGAKTLDENYHRFFTQPELRADVMAVPKIMTNSSASWVAMTWGIKGPCYCVSTACATATQSIGLAAMLVRSGMVERCIAGGSEALLVDGAFAAWEALHVMTNDKCRPFSARRSGMVLGEGAGIVVVEEREAALRRGATILAELAGYGTTSDAGDLLRPDQEGAANSMRAALADGGVDATDVGYINAHGTGTVANDVTETGAIRDVFGAHFDNLLISSTKPVHGHALGAGGGLELIVALRALNEQVAPPTLNFLEIDPKIGFAPVPGEKAAFSARAVLSNSFAFGGVNASLLLTRHDD